jgi:pimeloyl-ACP methyl ester carboxylesterase
MLLLFDLKESCKKILIKNPNSSTMKHAFLFIAFFAGSSVLAQKPIDTHEIVLIGGIKQYINIKGKNDSLPLLLFLHGGPGGSVMNYAHKFTDKLQEHFVVIQWDQRETGKTLQLNSSPVPLTLPVFQNDTHELIETLLRRFQQEKLYLVGHSWGTALGFYIAGKYPELLYACISIGPMINQLESERIILEMMKESARQTGNKKETEELATVKIPFENGEQLYYHRKWLFAFNGSSKKLSRSYVLTWSSTWLTVFNEASKDNFIESLPAIHCPVYFFAGRKDYQTNSGITEDYYTRLIAPKKGLFWFERSGHSIPSSEPGMMQDVISGIILPETFTIQKSKLPQPTR